MQTEAEAFLQQIRAKHDDDAPRLIFADWLDEQGDPRGRFIRVQLALAGLPEDSPARKALAAVESDLLKAHRGEWEAPLGKMVSGCVFHRGFVEEAKVEAQQLLRHAGEIFDASLVQHIHLLDIGDSLPAVLKSPYLRPYLSRLTALTVYAQRTGDHLAREVAKCEHLAGLRRLALTRNLLGDGAAEQLAGSPNLANLVELDLSENEISETGAQALAASPHLVRLRRLELGGNRLGPAGAEAVAGSERLASLHRLGLFKNDVGLPRLRTLSRAHDLLRVPVLDLSTNGLTPAGLQVILTLPAGADPAAVRLTELDLSANGQLGDDGARVLAKAASLANLAVLHLTNCAIGDVGARALADSPHFNRVTELNLENNPIGDSGFRPWLDTRHWKALRKLMPPRLGISHGMRLDLDHKFNRPTRRG